jgi:hypothetical protein
MLYQKLGLPARKVLYEFVDVPLIECVHVPEFDSGVAARAQQNVLARGGTPIQRVDLLAVRVR